MVSKSDHILITRGTGQMKGINNPIAQQVRIEHLAVGPQVGKLHNSLPQTRIKKEVLIQVVGKYSLVINISPR